MTFLRSLAFPALLLVTLGLAGEAQAFAPRTTSDGEPVRWGDFTGTPVFTVHAPEARTGIEGETLLEVVDRAISTWSQTSTGLDLELRYETQAEASVGWNRDAPDQNENTIIVTTEDWDYEDDGMAATLLTFSSTTGELLDADVVLNARAYDFAWITHLGDAMSSTRVDLLSVLVHELGHAIGLDHSEDPEATMFPYLDLGETWMADLAADDEAGATFLYPELGSLGGSALIPTLSPPDLGAGRQLGCSSSGASAQGLGLALPLVIALLLSGPRRRSFLAVVLTLAGLPSLALAQPVQEVPAAFHRAVEHADRIFVGEVTEVHASWEGRRIVSTLRTRLVECVQGDCPTEQQFRLVGGQVGDVVQALSSRPNPRKGEKIFLALPAATRTDLAPLAVLARPVLLDATGQLEVIFETSVRRRFSLEALRASLARAPLPATR